MTTDHAYTQWKITGKCSPDRLSEFIARRQGELLDLRAKELFAKVGVKL